MNLGFKPFRTTNVSVDCSANNVPIAEVTIEGSIADISPSGIKRLTDVIENAVNKRSNGLDISIMQIKDVIHNNPATIVFWEDGTKTKRKE